MTNIKEDRKALKAQLSVLDQILQNTYQMVKEERAHGPEFVTKLSEQLNQARADHEKLEKKMQKAKTYIKKRKMEITEWKQWYNGLGHHDKSKELKQLEDEIKWRADEIAAKQKVIAELIPQELEAEGLCEQLEIRLQALKEVDLNAPIEDDPRLQDIQEERQLIIDQLEVA